MTCQRHQRREPCRDCEEDETFLRAAPRTERFHFFRSVMPWLHGLRLGFSKAKRADLATRMSAVIYQVEEIEEASKAVDDEETEVH